MKRLIITLLFIFIFCLAKAQVSYFVPPEGKVLVYGSYANGDNTKMIGINKHFFKESVNPDTFVFVCESYSPPDAVQPESRGEVKYYRDGERIFSDPTAIFMGQKGVKISADFLEKKLIFPLVMKVGDKLDDYTITYEIDNEGTMMPMSIAMTNRNIAAKETITTPAGSFDCIRIDQNITSSIMGMTINSSSQTWYGKDCGMVRHQVFMGAGAISDFILIRIENKK